MPTIFVNNRGVPHQTSMGMSIVFPDICKTPTPGGLIPMPYPNIAMSAHTINGPMTVKCDGSMPMVQGAQYAISTGDEMGVGGGIISGTIKGPAEFMMYSFNVKFEGKNVCRLGDPLYHNNKNAMG